MLDDLNPQSLQVLENCRIEPGLVNAPFGEVIQFERQGYFCLDANYTPERLVFNRTTSLCDNWAKI